MVDCRALQARISHAKGVVEFPSDPDSFSSSGTWDRLNDLMHRCMAVSAKITDADHRVSCDKAYLSKIEVAGTLRTGIAGLPSNEARIAATIADLDDAADEMFPLV